jgi:uncharacterized protein (DUF1697 family)
MAYVVFLRGVNVGGHRRFRPAMLAQQLKRYGAVNIGAAGTLVIRVPTSQTQLRAELRRRLPFETHVMICHGREILGLVSSNPHGVEPFGADIVRFVTILPKRPRVFPALPIDMPSAGRWLVRIVSRENRYVFGVYRRHLKTIGYLGQMDTLFGMPATTRNWNTINAIVKVLSA